MTRTFRRTINPMVACCVAVKIMIAGLLVVGFFGGLSILYVIMKIFIE